MYTLSDANTEYRKRIAAAVRAAPVIEHGQLPKLPEHGDANFIDGIPTLRVLRAVLTLAWLETDGDPDAAKSRAKISALITHERQHIACFERLSVKEEDLRFALGIVATRPSRFRLQRRPAIYVAEVYIRDGLEHGLTNDELMLVTAHPEEPSPIDESELARFGKTVADMGELATAMGRPDLRPLSLQ